MGYSKYPSQIDSSLELPPATDNVTPVKAEVVNRLRDAILAIENELGINPSKEYESLKDRLNHIDNILANGVEGIEGPEGPVGPQGEPGETGAAGDSGRDGTSAYTMTTASFTQPASGSTVDVSVDNSDWMASGQVLFQENGGYYQVVDIVSSTTVTLKNLGYSSNASAASSISVAKLTPAGIGGTNSYATVSSFTQPAANGNVTVSVDSSSWMTEGQIVFHATGGYYQVETIPNSTSVTLKNLNYSGNASADATISEGKLSPAGIAGSIGSSGFNAFTVTTASFTQPASDSTVSITVGSTNWMSVGQTIFLENGGYYQVTAITNSTTATIKNLGYTGNASSGATVDTGAAVPAGPIGPAGSASSVDFNNSSFSIVNLGQSGTISSSSTIQPSGSTFYVTASIYCTGIRFYWKVQGTTPNTVDCSLWNSSATLLDHKSTDISSDGVYTISFTSPIALSAFKKYTISIYSSSGYTFFLSASLSITVPSLPFYAGPYQTIVSLGVFSSSSSNVIPTTVATNERYPIEPILSVT